MRYLCNRFAGFLLLALTISSGTPFMALAKEKQSIREGNSACVKWCWEHNKTETSRSKCYVACDIYWNCNGSDSTAYTCQFIKDAYKNLLQATPKNPTTPVPPSNAPQQPAR